MRLTGDEVRIIFGIAAIQIGIKWNHMGIDYFINDANGCLYHLDCNVPKHVVRRWDGEQWHDIRTNFIKVEYDQEPRWRNSNRSVVGFEA